LTTWIIEYSTVIYINFSGTVRNRSRRNVYRYCAALYKYLYLGFEKAKDGFCYVVGKKIAKI
jgi:hypothetical protein